MNYRIVATPPILNRLSLFSKLLDSGTPTPQLIEQASACVLHVWDPKSDPQSVVSVACISVASRLMMSIDMTWARDPVLSQRMTDLTHVWHEMQAFDDIYEALSNKRIVSPEMQKKVAQHGVRVGSMLLATNQSPEAVAFFREILPFFSPKLLPHATQSKYEKIASVGIVRCEEDFGTTGSLFLPKKSVLRYFLERAAHPSFPMPKERIRDLLDRDDIATNKTLCMALVCDGLEAGMPFSSADYVHIVGFSRGDNGDFCAPAIGFIASRPGSFSPYLSAEEFLGHVSNLKDEGKIADEICVMLSLCEFDVCKWHLTKMCENSRYLELAIGRLFEPEALLPDIRKSAMKNLLSVGQTVSEVFDSLCGLMDVCLKQSKWEMATDIFSGMMTQPMKAVQNRGFLELASRIPDDHRWAVLLSAVFSEETKSQAMRSLLSLSVFSEEALNFLRYKKDWESLPFARELFIGVQSLYRENDPQTHVRMVYVLATLLIRRDAENRLFSSPMAVHLAEPIKVALSDLLSDSRHSHHRTGVMALKREFPKKQNK